MPSIERARELQRTEGTVVLLERSIRFVLSPLQELYNDRVWPHLPPTAEYGTYNGVAVVGTGPPYVAAAETPIHHKYFDTLVPWMTPSSISNFKQPAVRAVQEYCSGGETVITVGGGYGVTAVHTASAVGPDGRVLIYEGDAERVKSLDQTLRLNDVAEVCEVVHQVVGEAYVIENDTTAQVVTADALPDCDVLEMDCEGAELTILRQLSDWPSTIIVELHHRKEFAPYSSPAPIRDILESNGYVVERRDGPWVDGLLVANSDARRER